MDWASHYHTAKKPKPLHKGLDAGVHSLIGVYQRRSAILRQIMEEAKGVDAMSDEFSGCDDNELSEHLKELRSIFRRGPKRGVEYKALAVAREAAHRKVGLRPFPVQLAGALALYRGFLVEMATGEGKTLTAGLAAILLGWTGRPCHVITVNDYLVERDAEWMKPLYQFCGVRVGCVTAGMQENDRRAGHRCDVTYTTSKELLADYLRDQLKSKSAKQPARQALRSLIHRNANPRGNRVLRGVHSAIVDEADSVLIDEAVTPLIISSPRKNRSLNQAIERAEELSRQLTEGTDYRLDAQYREVDLTSEGSKRVEALAQDWSGIWKNHRRREELIRQAVSAREFFKNGKQYIIQQNKVVIVDEFTGRPMPQRTWRQGMHQAIEIKEGLTPSDPSETVARMSFQRFFRGFKLLSGMTGTAREAANEFWQVYRLPVICIPTNRPCVRERWEDVVCKNEESKWKALMDEVRQVHAMGRPILIGTRSVFVSEKIADLLTEAGLEFQLLNATRLAEEAMIISKAGEEGHITVATNMAGRGTDIKLDREVAERGGLHVIATEHHESGRVDRQLFGRCGRQGDPGTARLFASLEDEIVRTQLRPVEKRLLTWNSRSRTFQSFWFHWSQRKAERRSFKQRKAVLRADRWLDEALSFAGGE